MNRMTLPVSSHIAIESALVQEMAGQEDEIGEGRVDTCARHESMWGNGGTASFILNLCTKWGELQALVVLPSGNEPQVPTE
jgi:hypothetical protein